MNPTQPLIKRRWFQLCILLIVLVLVPFYFLDFDKWSDISPAVETYVSRSPEVEAHLGRVESVQPKAGSRQYVRAGISQGTAGGTYSVIGSKSRGEIEVELAWDGDNWHVTQAILSVGEKQVRLAKNVAKP